MTQPSERQIRAGHRGADPQKGGTSGVPDRLLDRRTFVRQAGVVGVGVVGAAALSGCGGSAEPAAVSRPFTLAQKDVPVGGGIVDKKHVVVVTQPAKGEFKAFSATCTHQGCLVGAVENGTIDCFCHGSTFDDTTGAVVRGPATEPLPAKTVKLSGTELDIS